MKGEEKGMAGNVLVVHGGGPTAVINASLYGVIMEAKESGVIDHVYGAIGGSEAVLKEQFLDLMKYPQEANWANSHRLRLSAPPAMRWRKRIIRPWGRFLKSMISGMFC